ncbi:MAG: serine/threonine protein kinase [Lachnospiraceae bacterium]|nr:serine/threonine protein kinase [Lachnospiraceae bacterium]
METEQVRGHSGKKQIGRYMIIRVLGGGGEGNVYLARDEDLHRMVAIKQMWADTGKQEGKVIQEADFLHKFRHPMLPVVYDLVWDEAWYLVMEYIQGITLAEYIDKNGYVQEGQACTWTGQLLDILGYLHTRKPPVIYRDLKPDNIMVCPDGHLRLIDFGGASVKSYGTQERGVMAVTPGYGAPEQFGKAGQGVYADERSDIYAFGKVMYYMLTGTEPSKPPYTALPVCDYQPFVHERLELIVRRCIEEDPEKRYQMTEEIRRDLTKCVGRRQRLHGRSFIRIVEKKIWLTEM